MRKSIFYRFKSSLLLSAAILLSFSALLNLASGFLKLVYAASDCLAGNASKCRTVTIRTADTLELTTGNITTNTDSLDASDNEIVCTTTTDTGAMNFFTVACGLASSEEPLEVSISTDDLPLTVEVYTLAGDLIIEKKIERDDIRIPDSALPPEERPSNNPDETAGDESPSGDDNLSTSTVATCNSAAGGIGWIACTIIDLVANMINWAYDTLIEPSMSINVELFDTNTGTFKAWGIFRDIANILFVILLLVVIFSQLTGIGIDNYGIKKTLPKLILAAILVNLSYFICQLAIDVSNIIGASLNNFLVNLSNGLTIPETLVNETGVTFAGKTASILAFSGAVLAGGLLWAKIGGGLGTALAGAFFPIFGVVVGAGLAFLLLIFLLAMRQAVVVLLVAISPLAFVAYILPNTKNLFTKWLNILKAMLILFPACALLMGGGRLASKIILSTGGASGTGLFTLIVAMIAEVGPIFFIPTLTRNAYRGLGQLGGAIGRLSGRWTTGARNVVQRSRMAQDVAKRTNITAGLARAGRISRRFKRRQDLASSSNPFARAYGRALTGDVAKDRAAEAAKMVSSVNSANLQRDLWLREDYQESQRKHSANVVSAETTKMYQENAANFTKNQLEDNLRQLASAPNVQDRKEQFIATMRAMLAKGFEEDIMEVISDKKVSEEFQNIMMKDLNFANAISNEFGASGVLPLKEYSKHVGQNIREKIGKPGECENFVSFRDFMDGTGTVESKNGTVKASFGNSAGSKGIAGQNKDVLSFIAANIERNLKDNNNGSDILDSLSDEQLLRAFADAKNDEEVAQLVKIVQAITSLDPNANAKNAQYKERVNRIATTMSGFNYVNIDDRIKEAMANGKNYAVAFSNARIELSRPENAQLAARLSSAQSEKLGVNRTQQIGRRILQPGDPGYDQYAQ